MTRAETATTSEQGLDDLEQAVLRRLGARPFETEEALLREVAADGATSEDEVAQRLERLSLATAAG